jgi:hypothetical protein
MGQPVQNIAYTLYVKQFLYLNCILWVEIGCIWVFAYAELESELRYCLPVQNVDQHVQNIAYTFYILIVCQLGCFTVWFIYCAS